jgi:hypothetical protein
MRILIACAALALAACAPEAAAPKGDAAPAATAAAKPAEPAGPAVVVKARNEATDHHRDTNVSRVVGLKTSDSKFFTVVGGDPAINGEYLYLAVAPEGPDEDFKVYMIGDFNTWDLESEGEGQAVIKVSRSSIDDAGEIKTAEERLIVTVPAWSASETTVTPAK